MAVAIQTDQHWVTIGWAAEGLMLVWVGLRADESAARHAALAVFAVALAHWFGWDVDATSYREGAAFVPLLNRRALSCAALVGALAGAAWLHRREELRVLREELDGRAPTGEGRAPTDEGRGVLGAALEEHSAAATLYTLAANALALALLTLDLNDYFERRLAAAGDEAHAAGRVENARSFSVTALWTFYAAAMFALGVRRRFRALRYIALALLGMATVKALASDLAFYAAPWHVPLLNQTCMAFALLVAAYAFAVRLYRGAAPAPDDGERAVIPVLVVVGNLLAVVALSAEAFGYFAVHAGELAGGKPRDMYLAQQLSLSLVWALYGGGLLLFGYLKEQPPAPPARPAAPEPDDAQGLLPRPLRARPRLPHHLLRRPRRDPPRRLLPLPEEPAAHRPRESGDDRRRSACRRRSDMNGASEGATRATP